MEIPHEATLITGGLVTMEKVRAVHYRGAASAGR
jgi:hypothetical protein